MRGAGVLGVTHDVGALPAVAVVRVAAAGRVVGPVEQHAGQPAAIVGVARTGLLAARPHHRLAQAVLHVGYPQAVGQDDQIAAPGSWTVWMSAYRGPHAVPVSKRKALRPPLWGPGGMRGVVARALLPHQVGGSPSGWSCAAATVAARLTARRSARESRWIETGDGDERSAGVASVITAAVNSAGRHAQRDPARGGDETM